jgi:hypothetical protein
MPSVAPEPPSAGRGGTLRPKDVLRSVLRFGSCGKRGHAGHLGPWPRVVSAVGIEPRSTLMKSIHLGLGAAWLVVMICFAVGLPWAGSGMLVCAVLGLWYLPFGTVLSLVQIVLLLQPAVRGGGL